MIEHDELIDKLKIAREDINLIIGMINKMETYRSSILEAKEKIDTVLYDLTGDKFYKDKLLGDKDGY